MSNVHVETLFPSVQIAQMVIEKNYEPDQEETIPWQLPSGARVMQAWYSPDNPRECAKLAQLQVLKGSADNLVSINLKNGPGLPGDLTRVKVYIIALYTVAPPEA